MSAAPDDIASRATLYYAHDPMCSWCFGFAPVWKQLQATLPEGVVVRRLLGGLAPDTDAPMPDEMRERLQATWQRIESHIPGVTFNFDFWTRCQPRRSTYPACRAVIAARAQGAQFDEAMTYAIQRAYYQQARNPSDDSTLIELAGELGLDAARFAADLRDPATQEQLLAEIEEADALGASGYPSLILVTETGRWPIQLDYREAGPMRDAIVMVLEATNA